MTLAPTMSRSRGGNRQAVYPVYRWDPFRDIQQTNDRLGQLIRTLFAETGAWSPTTVPVDVEETDDSYVVDVELPNVNPQDVTLEMRGEELRIAGRFQQWERTGVVRRQNRPEGEFEYLVDLPSDIDPNEVEATYNDGVLTVKVARRRRRHSRAGSRSRPGSRPGSSRGSAPQQGRATDSSRRCETVCSRWPRRKRRGNASLRVDHAVQVRCRDLDVEMLVLAGAHLRGQHAAPVQLLEVAVRKPVPRLAVLGYRGVHAQMPARVLPRTVLGDELVLLPSRRLVLAPQIPVVGDEPALFDEAARVFVAPLVQLDTHRVTGSRPDCSPG